MDKIRGRGKDPRKSRSDAEQLSALLDEGVAYAIEGFRRGGVTLTRAGAIEMFSEAPLRAGDLYPLIEEELDKN